MVRHEFPPQLRPPLRFLIITAPKSRRTECRRSAHNVLLLGPPGAGTSMLARRLTTILPAMTLAEAIETTRIHSVAGLTGDRTAVVTTRPFRAPHHTISDAGLIVGCLVKTSAGSRRSLIALSCPCMVRRPSFFTNSDMGRHGCRQSVAGAPWCTLAGGIPGVSASRPWGVDRRG
jgi:hypothetical protein